MPTASPTSATTCSRRPRTSSRARVTTCSRPTTSTTSPTTSSRTARIDQVEGGAGNDVIHVGAGPQGSDAYQGDAGADQYDASQRSGNLTVTNDGNSNDGEPGEGDNTLAIVTNAGPAGCVAGPIFPVVQQVPGGGAGVVGQPEPGAGNEARDFFALEMTGGSGNDVLVGDQAANVLTGNAGNDTLSGEAGAIGSTAATVMTRSTVVRATTSSLVVPVPTRPTSGLPATVSPSTWSPMWPVRGQRFLADIANASGSRFADRSTATPAPTCSTVVAVTTRSTGVVAMTVSTGVRVLTSSTATVGTTTFPAARATTPSAARQETTVCRAAQVLTSWAAAGATTSCRATPVPTT